MKQDKITGKNKIIIALLIIILALVFFSSISTRNCDKDFHIERLNELADEIKELGIVNYPYYINYKSFGNMGYPTETFYSDIFLILPALTINLGFSTNFIYAVTVFISFILILISSFLSFKFYIKDKENAIFFSINKYTK